MVVRDKSIPTDQIVTIQTPRDIYRLVAGETDLLRLDREAIYGIFLDARNQLLGIELISLGTLNSSLVHPREVFKSAILLGSGSLIIVHNHPSGDVAPSSEDIELTRRLSKVGTLMGIELLDHVIVSEGKHHSIKESTPNTFADESKANKSYDHVS